MQSTKPERVEYLDGLRGLAAQIVVASHLLCGFLPSYYFGQGEPGGSDWFSRTPLFALGSGHFAVCIFFVLSGYVLAGASARKNWKSLPQRIVGRYVRLVLPSAAAILIVFGLWSLGLMRHLDAAHVSTSHWLGIFPQPDLGGDALARQLAGFYLLSGGSDYLGVLWTMRIELIGSICVFAVFCISEKIVRLTAIAAAILIGPAFGADFTYYSAFFWGAALFEMRVQDWKLPTGIVAAMLVVAALLGGYPSASGGLYEDALSFVFAPLSAPKPFAGVIAAAALLVAVSASPMARTALSSAPALYLGRISFGVYLLHMPLMLSFFSGLYLLGAALSPAFMVFAICAYLMSVLIAGSVFVRLIDKPSVSIARAISRAKLPLAGLGQPSTAYVESASD